MSSPLTSRLVVSRFPVPCPHTITEKFILGTEPERFDDWHQAIALDRRNGLRAGPNCPLDFVAFQTFTLYPAEAADWSGKQGILQPPDIYSPLCPNREIANDRTSGSATGASIPLLSSAPSLQGLIFTSPDPGSVFRLVPNIPGNQQKIRIRVRPTNGQAVPRVSLLINGELLADGPETLWQMRPGVYTFEAVGADNEGQQIRANGVTVKVVE